MCVKLSETYNLTLKVRLIKLRLKTPKSIIKNSKIKRLKINGTIFLAFIRLTEGAGEAPQVTPTK